MSTGRRKRWRLLTTKLPILRHACRMTSTSLDAAYDPVSEPLEEVRVNPRSTDMTLAIFGLLWLPYRRDSGGRLVPDWS